MRSPGTHAALGSFTALEEPTVEVMRRGVAFSSAARFPGRDDLASSSLLLQSQGGHDSDFVRVELLADPADTAKLSGVEFELLGGPSPLGRGKVLKAADELSLKERIVFFAIRHPGRTDSEISRALNGSSTPQPVNRACRELVDVGKLERKPRKDGLIGNYPVSALYVSPRMTAIGRSDADSRQGSGALQEDEVKERLDEWLTAAGWRTNIAWGKERGVDIEAVNTKGRRWLIEVKGCGSLQAMRANYFIAVLGETLQRMDDPAARYSIAFPDMAQFRGLWERLPRLAKDRTCVSMLLVSADGEVREFR